MFYVFLYLVAIVLANLSVARFGPSSAIVNAFLFIGLDLTSRDKLHDAWHRRGLMWKMGLLIMAGSLLTVLFNWGARRVALASTLAFALAALADTAVYHLLRERARLLRVNGSNVVGAAIDSLVFPWVAFGAFLPFVIGGQFLAKVVGGALWALILGMGKVQDG